MEAGDVALTAEVENRHWWYRERRRILAREVRRLRPGRAVEIGAAGGGNSLVLKSLGWSVLATEFLLVGTEIARDRGLAAAQADARRLPVASGSCDFVMALDVLEHIEEDDLAAAEMVRILRPGGQAFIAVPCDMALWSAHDVASGHVRRYNRPILTRLAEDAGMIVDSIWSWNVILRPVVSVRRRVSHGSDLHRVGRVVNAGLSAVVAAERFLPTRSLPGVSLMLRAHRPA